MATAEYLQFIESKSLLASEVGINIDPSTLNPNLFPFQRWSVDRLLRMGRAALFGQTGTGKSIQELAWLEAVTRETGSPVLLLTPLAVGHQTYRDAGKYGVECEIRIIEDSNGIGDGINICNYEKLHKLDSSVFAAIALDESSCIKHDTSKTYAALCDFAQQIPYKLAATATPSPNDQDELGTHAEFLGIMSKSEMLSTFFTKDSSDSSKWVLGGWGRSRFWEWVCSWAVIYEKPSDIGFSDEGYILPPLRDHIHIVDSVMQPGEGELFPTVASMNDRRRARKSSINERVEKAVELITSDEGRKEQWLVWCSLNDEADAIESALQDVDPFCLQVAGRHKPEIKIKRAMDFVEGNLRVLISKPEIFGWGMNWQQCRNVLFLGIDDSYEKLHQATNRLYRFGQTKEVNRHLVFSHPEYVVYQNLKRKEELAKEMWSESRKYVQQANHDRTKRDFVEYNPQVIMTLPGWLKSA